jgi:MerR family transcriptional regulator, light-induced transcriptional regulator
MADESALTGDAVARRLGLAPSTLRSWRRRYGVAVGRPNAGGHVLYTAEDVAYLAQMRSLIAAGMPPREAARVVLAERAPAPGAPGDRSTIPARRWSPGYASVPRDLIISGSSAAVRELADAAMALDAHLIVEIIRVAVACDGVIGTWEDLLIPLIAGISDQQRKSGSLIDVEHVLTAAACDVLAEASAALSRPVQHPPVLLSCAEDEQHTMSLHVLAAALAEEGVATRMLGARVPRRALGEAIWRSHPAVVFLWSQTAATGDPAPLADLRDHPSRPRIFVGGPGWDPAGIPDAVQFLPSLPAAVAEVEAALGLARLAQQRA